MQSQQNEDIENHSSLGYTEDCLNGVINEDDGFAFVLVNRVYPGLVTRVAFQCGSGVGLVSVKPVARPSSIGG
jgi:hypothetical protein